MERFEGIAHSMMPFDITVNKSNSINPVDHSEIELESRSARIVREAVDGLYKYGCAVWCRKLVTYRNQLLITVRSILTGRNPIAEWNRFVQAGGWYFLQYPQLCP